MNGKNIGVVTVPCGVWNWSRIMAVAAARKKFSASPGEVGGPRLGTWVRRIQMLPRVYFWDHTQVCYVIEFTSL